MQRLLLDTHVFLWWLTDDARLGSVIREKLSNPQNEIYISAVSGWEISIKRSLGKLRAPESLYAFVEDAGFEHLPISFFHGEKSGGLPMHHRDPFDRMLTAQAQAEGLDIVTSDKDINKYGVFTIDASK